MDLMTIAAFVAFLALVVAWMMAPTDASSRRRRSSPSMVGAD